MVAKAKQFFNDGSVRVLLEIQNIRKSYPGESDRPVLAGVTLNLDAGETLALTGESGSGKSTLLHLAGALDQFEGGEILVQGRKLSELNDSGRAALRRGPVALVFQQFNLIPSLNVSQNLAFHAKIAERHDPDWLTELSDRLGLDGLQDRFPEQLSGGQQQRVAIGRALAARPALMLADEPTGNLDETASGRVMALMLDLVARSGTALFLATHSDKIANQLDRRVHLSGGTIR